MRLFDFLLGGKNKSRIEDVPDGIWMTANDKFAGIAKDISLRKSWESVAILLVAHFPDVLSRLEKIADEQHSDVPVKAVLANALNVELAASLNLDEEAIVDVIVGEHHPLPSVDDRLEEFADNLPCCCRLSYHVSLEDAVIEVFAGEWGPNKLLTELAMRQQESIDSSEVTSRFWQYQHMQAFREISKNRQMIEGRSFGSPDANSANEWLEKNCPDLIKK